MNPGQFLHLKDSLVVNACGTFLPTYITASSFATTLTVIAAASLQRGHYLFWTFRFNAISLNYCE